MNNIYIILDTLYDCLFPAHRTWFSSDMQPAPSPSAGRGDVVLQPAFFTSILYVQPLREDVSTLTKRFRERYSECDSAVSPFSVFKQLWRSEGWKWLHFKVLDDRARETFLVVTTRIFLGLHHFPGLFFYPLMQRMIQNNYLEPIPWRKSLGCLAHTHFITLNLRILLRSFIASITFRYP